MTYRTLASTTYMFKWLAGHRDQCPGERAREWTAANSQLPPSCPGRAGKQDILQDKPEAGLQSCPLSVVPALPAFPALVCWHLPFLPSPEDQRNPGLQVLSLPLEEQTRLCRQRKVPIMHATCLAGHVCISTRTQQQSLEAHKPAGDCMMCLRVPVRAELPAAPGFQPQLVPVAGPALCCARPLHQACPECSVHARYGHRAASPFSPAGPGYGSQPGGELPFAKLDNRPGCLSEDWRSGSTCCCWHGASPALPGSRNEAWLQPELAGGRAGGGRAGWGPCCPLAASGSRPARLQSLRLPSPLLPPQLLLNSQSKLLLPCPAATGSEWPLPWTCLRFSSPCWSTLCLGQRRRQVGMEVACTGWPPKCPRGGGSHKYSGRTGISKLGRVPAGVCLWSGPGPVEGLGCRQRHGGECPLGLPAQGGSGERVATDRCCAYVGQGQDQRTMLRKCTGC